MALKGSFKLEKNYNDVKMFDTFNPKSIQDGIESYFASNLYEFSYYNYFCNLNMFVINSNNKLQYNRVIPFKDKERSKYLNNKIICQNFYPNESSSIVKHINSVILNLKDSTFVEYFIEVTFPNIFGHFISDDLCQKGFDFLVCFSKLDIPLEKNLLFTGLLSKFIRSDLNFLYSMFDSFNSLYSTDARHDKEKYIDCLKKAARYSFSLLNSYRIQALRLVSQNIQIFKKCIIDIIIKIISSWEYDSYYICYNDENFKKITRSPKASAKIFDYVKDVIDERKALQYQENKIGLLFADKQVLPIILTRTDLQLIDQIFIEAKIQPLFVQNQSNLDFHIEDAFIFTMHRQSFIDKGISFDAETTNSPKKQSYLKFREDCISKCLNPIDEKRKEGTDKISEIKSQKSWSAARKNNEIAQVKNNYDFALNLEINICNKHSTFQKNLNAYSDRVFKSNMFAVKRYLNQVIHWICYYLREKVQNETQINQLVNKEMKCFLEMNAPTSVSPIPEQLITKASAKKDYKTDDFFIFIQKEFFSLTNYQEIFPLNNLTENRPLLFCLTELRQSLFLYLELNFECKFETENNVNLDDFFKIKDKSVDCNSFVKLLLENTSKIDMDRIMIFTFIEIFHIPNIEALMYKCFDEAKKTDSNMFNRFLRNYRKSQNYYKFIKDKIPGDFNDVFSYFVKA